MTTKTPVPSHISATKRVSPELAEVLHMLKSLEAQNASVAATAATATLSRRA